MDQSQPSIDLLGEEPFVRQCCLTYALARRWERTAADTRLDSLLSPAGIRTLEDVLGRVRDRDILSPDCTDAIRRLAETCSTRIGELGSHLVAPAARQRASEANHTRDLVLSEHSVELFALAEAIEEVLDLQEALRARQRIGALP